MAVCANADVYVRTEAADWDSKAAIVIHASGNAYFNAEAAGWDERSDMNCASDGALNAILERFPELWRIKKGGKLKDGNVDGPDVLEIGCGTGLLSFRISPYVRSLLAVDTCAGMIAALEKKLAIPGAPGNIESLCAMLEDSEDPCLPPASTVNPYGPRRKFDLVLGHLLLHHVSDLHSMLAMILGCLKPGGWVALTDFEDFGPQARRFHPEAKMHGVERDGIKRVEFARLMKGIGLVDVRVEVGWTMQKEVERWPGEWGKEKPEGAMLETMEFPFLVCMGRRP